MRTSPLISSTVYTFIFSLSKKQPRVRLHISSMDDSKDKQRNVPWLSVPQFGEWDQKGPLPDYSLDFSKIREMRKQNKRDPSRASLGNEQEFINPTAPGNKTVDNEQDFVQNHSPTARKSFISYFNCCVKA